MTWIQFIIWRFTFEDADKYTNIPLHLQSSNCSRVKSIIIKNNENPDTIIHGRSPSNIDLPPTNNSAILFLAGCTTLISANIVAHFIRTTWPDTTSTLCSSICVFLSYRTSKIQPAQDVQATSRLNIWKRIDWFFFHGLGSMITIGMVLIMIFWIYSCFFPRIHHFTLRFLLQCHRITKTYYKTESWFAMQYKYIYIYI